MNSFAIVETGGKQVRLEPNQVVRVERLVASKPKADVLLEKVLAIQKDDSFQVGTPYVEGAKVVCESLGEVRGPKQVIFKMKRRKNYRRKKGHRQTYSELRVKEIIYGTR